MAKQYTFFNDYENNHGHNDDTIKVIIVIIVIITVIIFFSVILSSNRNYFLYYRHYGNHRTALGVALFKIFSHLAELLYKVPHKCTKRKQNHSSYNSQHRFKEEENKKRKQNMLHIGSIVPLRVE